MIYIISRPGNGTPILTMDCEVRPSVEEAANRICDLFGFEDREELIEKYPGLSLNIDPLQ